MFQSAIDNNRAIRKYLLYINLRLHFLHDHAPKDLRDESSVPGDVVLAVLSS